MPRPGPRPYECVRRAWHSDRHQPMRGSVIQQIFRAVQESHSPVTKKNKEWQEKLPIVAEYMDIATLWDRVNDAINTIIKRDESTETGDLLPPCVEAALNLGCVPVRASRSQRNANPRSYLGQKTQDPNNTTNEWNPQLPPLHSGNLLASPRPVSMNSTQSSTTMTQSNSCNNHITHCNFPSPCVEVPPPSNHQFIPVESNTSPNVGLVYPLYYGTQLQPEMPQSTFQVPRNPNAIFFGRPIFPSIAETTKKGFLQNLFSCERDENTSNRVRQADSRKHHGKAPETGFDLSLRLGLFKEPCIKPGRVVAHDTPTVDVSSSQEGIMFTNLSPHQNKEFSFFPVDIANDPFECHRSRWNSEGGGQNVEAATSKRKAQLHENLEDGLFFSQPELRSSQFVGRMKRPGS
ncbi:hypothetical protein C3L33_03707, partial [Rhododendron williamsianum]